MIEDNNNNYSQDIDTGWVNWEFVPLKPEWLTRSVMDRCKKEGIPIRILRTRRKDGKEEIIIQEGTEDQIKWVGYTQLYDTWALNEMRKTREEYCRKKNEEYQKTVKLIDLINGRKKEKERQGKLPTYIECYIKISTQDFAGCSC